VVLALMGSHSHGTYLPPSEPTAIDDVDLMGFVVPPLRYHLGLERWEHWVFRYQELDVVLYGLGKAFRLLLRGNPNIVGVLWLRDQEYVVRTSTFERMRWARPTFASQIAAESFVGYAHDQLKRMEAFSLERMEEYEQLSALLKDRVELRDVIQADRPGLRHFEQELGISRDHLERFRKLHRQHFSGYMGEKRKAMVRKYSYDVKNAAHLIRLLRMGSEFMRSGTLQVFRTDAEELKAIKRGEWSLAQVKEEAERLFARLEHERSVSPLPAEPDTAAADALLVELHRSVLRL
jgi:hypothetical protein